MCCPRGDVDGDNRRCQRLRVLSALMVVSEDFDMRFGHLSELNSVIIELRDFAIHVRN